MVPKKLLAISRFQPCTPYSLYITKARPRGSFTSFSQGETGDTHWIDTGRWLVYLYHWSDFGNWVCIFGGYWANRFEGVQYGVKSPS